MLRSRFLWKLYAGYAVLILLTTGIVGVLVSGRISEDSRQGIQQGLSETVLLIGDSFSPYLDSHPNPEVQERLAGLDTETRVTLMSADGTVIADSREDPALMDNHITRPEVQQAFGEGMGNATRFSKTIRQEMMYVARRVEQDGQVVGFVRAALPLNVIDQRLARLRGIVLLGALLAAVVALLLGFLVANRFTAPLTSMTTAVQSIAAGEFQRKVDYASQDELGQLASSFNRMGEELRMRMDTINRDRGKLLAILGGMVEGVIAVDDSQTVLHINDPARRMMNAMHAEWVGRQIWEIPNGDAVAQIVAQTLKDDGHINAETRLRSSGRDLVVELFASPLRDGDRRSNGAVVVLHDITELRHLESVRRDFVANASHELKTPITAIRGLVETLIEDPEMPENTRDRFLGRIRDQSTRLSALVSDLLTLSRLETMEPGEKFPFDFRQVIRESVKQLVPSAENKGLSLESDLPPDPIWLAGDSADLRQVVDNLVDNAIKYTPPQGRIRIELERRNGTAVFSVSDTGIGIDPVHQDRIFERFYRVDQARSRELGGTGLGLSIVKHIAQSLSGRVHLESVPGQGSTFTVEVPVARSLAALEAVSLPDE